MMQLYIIIRFTDCGGNGWLYWKGDVSQNGICYNLQEKSTDLNWDEAYTECQSMQSKLATPSTAEQNQAVLNIIR